MELNVDIITTGILSGSLGILGYLIKDILSRKNRNKELKSVIELNTAQEDKSESETILNLQNSIDRISSNYGNLNQKYIESIEESTSLKIQVSEIVRRQEELEHNDSLREEELSKMRINNIQLMTDNEEMKLSLATLESTFREYEFGVTELISQLEEIPVVPRWKPQME